MIFGRNTGKTKMGLYAVQFVFHQAPVLLKIRRCFKAWANKERLLVWFWVGWDSFGMRQARFEFSEISLVTSILEGRISLSGSFCGFFIW